MTYFPAAHKLHYLVTEARSLKLTRVALKDQSEVSANRGAR
jgi:hypothetical protein